MSRNIHMSQSVRGFLNNFRTKRELESAMKFITKDDGSRFSSPDELRDAFMDELAKGHEVIPMGDCPTFDFVHGCPGHEIADEDESAEVING